MLNKKQAFSRLLLIYVFFFFLISKSQAQNQTVENGMNVTKINFPGVSCLYNWTNSNPSIGLPASGIGDIPSFTATNTGNTPITASITAIPVDANGYAYIISNQNPGTTLNSVSVVGTVDNNLITTIKVGTDPIGIAANPDGSRVYVTNTLNGTVSVINTSTNTVVATIPVGSYPWGIVVSPDGSRVYNTNFNNSNISVIDAKTNTVLRTIPAGQNPYCLAINPDGKTLYVTNYYSNQLTVVDINSGAVIATVNTGIEPRFVVISPDGSKVYVSNYGSSSISVINTATNTLDHNIQVEENPVPIVLNLDGTFLYVQNTKSGNVTVINTTTSSVVATIPSGAGSNGNGIALSPDGTRVYVTNAVLHSVIAINTRNNEVYAKPYIGQTPRGIGNFIIGGSGCKNTFITITVNPNLKPTLNTTQSTIKLNTIYGSFSSSSSFSLTGNNLKGSVLVTAPVGFELSSDNINFSKTISLNNSGTLNSTIIYTRIAKGIAANVYNGDITVSSASADDINIAITGTVNPAPLSIKLSPIGKTYGIALSNNITTIFTSTGLQNSDVIDNITISYGLGSSATSLPGTYLNSVTGSLANGALFLASNYSINYLPEDIYVVAAPLNIKADNKTKYANQPNPPLTISYTGFVNNETYSQLTSQAIITTNATQNSPAGKYIIGVSGASALQYSITYEEGTLTILELENLKIPNTFTPNGDGVNDQWEIPGFTVGQKCKLKIFGRNGLMVFASNLYQPWDGTFNGKPLPVGTYYFIVDIEGIKKFTGSISIIK